MKRFSIKQTVVMAGAVASLALGTGFVPGLHSPTVAQAAELSAQGTHRGESRAHNDFRHDERFRHEDSFRGHRYFAREGFYHQFWGWGFHRLYPEYYTVYYYEPVNVCSAYYFDDSEGVWYCFTGS